MNNNKKKYDWISEYKLTLGKEIIIYPERKTIKLNITENLSSNGLSIHALFRFCKREWLSNSDLSRFVFPILAGDIHDYELANGWKFEDQTSEGLIKY